MRSRAARDVVTAPNVFRRICGAAVILISLAAAAVAGSIWQSRNDWIEEAQRAAGNIASVIAEQIFSSAKSVDLVLDDVKSRAEIMFAEQGGTWSDASKQEIFRYLTARLSSLGQADTIAILDSSGNSIVSTTSFPATTINFAERDYFLAQVVNASGGHFVGSPVQSIVTGKLTVYSSARLAGPSGQFLGVVMVGVQPVTFARIDAISSTLNGQSFLLLHRDGTILARFPDTVQRAGRKMPAESEWYRVAASGGAFWSPGIFDKTPRFVVVRPVSEWPFVVNVATSEVEALRLWRIRSVEAGLGGALACICLMGLIWALRNQFSRVNRGALLFEAALQNMSQGLAMFDKAGGLVVCNDTLRAMFALTEQQTEGGTTVAQIKAAIVENGFYLGGEKSSFLTSRLAPGELLTLPVNDHRTLALSREETGDGGFVITLSDVTERSRALANLENLALHDPLTGLANRTKFRNHLIDGLSRAVEHGETTALLYIDLDGFKHVNDTLGHPVGDSLLRLVAARLQRCTRPTDYVARLGGDEFAVMVEGVKRLGDLSGLCQRIVDTMQRPFDVEGHQIQVSTSVGIALAPRDGRSPDALARHADLALYRAKAEGRATYRFFEPEFGKAAQRRRELEIRMREALENGEFELFYQPIVKLKEESVVGFEALIRWRDPVRGLVPPAEFIPLAEETGLIIPLGAWVLTRACEDALLWPLHMRVGVNVSSVQIRHSDFIATVRSVIQRTHLDARRLVIEITESVLLQETEANLEILANLREMGIKISMDDFGTGYSSLSYLRQFTFDAVKIDRSFVSSVCDAGTGRAVVRAVIEISSSIGMATVGEGVETEEQLEALRELGCSMAQGFLFSRPCPSSEIPTVLRALENRRSGAVNARPVDLQKRAAPLRIV
ncbi:MAG: diguanylate cyclase [Hyphomicrobiales bacterium]|nr:diguanylate cyclase [Hyphomicrobiales bacterium]